ncbi:MAG: transcription termination/antitermination protein NusA [Synergistaceae bacterium]|nr:transcription termination/antitermination protein NusA [Synergistaceae bacterium]
MRLGREFVQALNQIVEERNIDLGQIVSGLEAALIAAYKKYQGGNQEAEVRIDLETGTVSISELRKVVETLESPDTEITLEDAKRLGFVKANLGDELHIEQNPVDFGRIAAQTARQVIIQRLKDAERQVIYDEFADKVGEMMNGIVFKTENDQVLVRIGERTEAILPRKERIPGEKYKLGTVMKFYVLDVRQMTRGPRIVVSRTHPGLLRKLMELEIPEVRQGVIEIRNIVREGGARAKVSLASLDPNVDAVGACVGNAGTRIKAISKELKGEKVDIIPWSEDPLTYIRNALSPAQIAKVEPLLDQDHTAHVYVYPDQLSLAIGKSGQNVRLAARLTGWKIDITSMEAERMPTLQDIFHDVTEAPAAATEAEQPEGPKPEDIFSASPEAD